MQYLLQIYSNDSMSTFDTLPEDGKAAVMGEYMAISGESGVIGGAQLQPAETATTVRVQDGHTLTTDGPFLETKEVLAGVTVIDARDLDHAVALAKLTPIVDGGVEVRPLIGFGVAEAS